jgi:hypothetical protein
VVHANEEFRISWWLKGVWQFVAEKGESGVTEDVANCGGFGLVDLLLAADDRCCM